MRRPRWHDVVIVVAIVHVLAVGLWAIWWDDVRARWWPDTDKAAETQSQPQT